MTVVSDYVIAIVTLSDWFKNLMPVYQPMRRKTKVVRALCPALLASYTKFL